RLAEWGGKGFVPCRALRPDHARARSFLARCKSKNRCACVHAWCAPHFATRAQRAAQSLGFILLALVSSFLYAQQRPDAGQVLEQTREPLRLPSPAEPVLPQPPEPKPALPVAPQLRVKVQQFTFTGNTLYSEAQLQPLVEQFTGKEFDFEGLNEAATKVRAFYR